MEAPPLLGQNHSGGKSNDSGVKNSYTTILQGNFKICKPFFKKFLKKGFKFCAGIVIIVVCRL